MRVIRIFGVQLLACALLVLPWTASARWYDPGTGRFLSEDPLLEDVLNGRKVPFSTPVRLTPWLYAAGNPLKYVDPDGREPDMPLAGNEIANQCALWGDRLSFCRTPEAMARETVALREKINSSSAAGASLTLGGATMGVRGLALAWALATTLDVAQQTYADPSRPKPLDEVDLLSAGMTGARMCAVPPVVKGISALGWGGKVLVTGVLLYASGHAIAEGAGQCWQGVQQGDAGRGIYGASQTLMGLSGAAWSYSEVARSLPYDRLPNWAFTEAEVKAGPGPTELGMFRLLRANLREPSPDWVAARAELAAMRQQMGLPRLGHEDAGVLSKLELGDQSFYGINGGQSSDTIKFVGALTRAGGGKQPLFQFLRHAEGDAFISAYNAGASARNGRLFVDTPLCEFCSSSLRNAMRFLGLEELTVYSPETPAGKVVRLEE